MTQRDDMPSDGSPSAKKKSKRTITNRQASFLLFILFTLYRERAAKKN